MVQTRLTSLTLAAALLSCVAACDVDLGPRTVQNGGSFGSIVFREACQRVTYSTELEAHAANTSRLVDASGVTVRALCAGEVPPADTAAPAVRALFGEHDDLVSGVDGALPNDSMLSSLDGYLQALTPLEDDGTVDQIITRTAALLASFSADPDLIGGLTRLNHSTGIRAPDTAGGVIRAVARAPGLDNLIGASIPLLLSGGAARDPFVALLHGGGFELRHIRADADPQSPERTSRLLVNLVLSHRDDLKTNLPLPMALRDFRGLPLFTDIAPPYVKDPATGLARADADGRFTDAAGALIPYVAPLPEPGQKDAISRDSQGRVLRQDGKLLYQYPDLDGSLLMALLTDGNRLFATKKAGTDRELDIPFGLLRGASLLLGSRDPAATKTKDNETLTYTGFNAKDATLLDLAHGALAVLRFRTGGAPGKEIGDLLQSTQTLLGTPANEGPLSRSLGALLAAADQAKKPIYDNAKLPADSTLYDDLAPILARVFAVPGLAEDIVAALKDAHGKALGPMTAQLMNDRDDFFMKQPQTAEDLSNGFIVPTGVIGAFGNPPNRTQPDSDATLDWRNQKTSDPANNRSVLQRLLHMLADSNGRRPLCNGRFASIFGGFVIFPGECDMFQLDNLARFFLLSIATPALRMDPATFAPQAASFRAAIQNGFDCRCRPGDPDPKKRCTDPGAGMKCSALLNNVTDNGPGDDFLEGLIRIKGFYRYPDPQPGGRVLFLDLGNATSIPAFAPQSAKDVMFNHIQNADLSLSVDPADPDDRKYAPDDAQGKHLYINDHNGVLFALESVRGPAAYSDGTANPFPGDTFYDALRPLVDAFAKHAECFVRDNLGVCTSGQNATQILADAMGILHRHWPSARSRIFGRSFADSYGPLVQPDGAQSYEPLAAQVMAGDLLPATADLSPILTGLTLDGQAGSDKALPLLVKALRFVFDPSMAPAGLYPRNQPPTTQALRNNGKPAYDDPTLTQVLGASQAGKWSIYYVLADALKKNRVLFDAPENQAAKDRWNQAVSDAIDTFLAVKVTDMMGKKTYQFDNPRIRPVSVLLLDFLRTRVAAHAADLPGFSGTLEQDTQDALTGPLAAALVDLGVRLEADDNARRATYTLLQQVLDPAQKDALRAMVAAAADGTQVLLDDADLVPLGKGLSLALDPDKGPVDPVLTLTAKGRALEKKSQDIVIQPFLPALLGNFYTIGPDGAYPMFRISDAIAEVNRATPGQPGSFVREDYRVLLDNVANFLSDQERGLSRFITIIRNR